MVFVTVIFLLAIIGGLIYLNHKIAKKFEEIVFAKGYGTELKAYYMCFWLGIVGYLYVIALPNAKLDNIQIRQRKRILEMLETLSSDSGETNLEKGDAES